MNRINLLVIGAFITVVALVSFQYYWIKSSRKLIEDQFNNKVSMALCSAIDKFSQDPSCCKLKSTIKNAGTDASCKPVLDSMIQDTVLMNEINASLQFYNVKLPYDVVVKAKDSVGSNYACSLEPILAQDDHWLQVMFREKTAFADKQLNPIWLISILIILFIVSLFAFATHLLFRQRKIAQDNISYFNHMTHEFSTPLTNIQLATKLIQNSTTNEKTAQYAEVISNQSNQLKNKVQNVLMMASIDQSGFTLNKSKVKIDLLIHEVMENMKLQIHDKNAEIRMVQTDTNLEIVGDPFHLKNVFNNLIDNVLKYCKAPKLEIEFQKVGVMSGIHFKDNGPGISLENTYKIFDPYVKEGSCNGQNGFGLGLAYVKRIVEMHNGYVQLKPLHNGSTFSLYFPSNLS